MGMRGGVDMRYTLEYDRYFGTGIHRTLTDKL